MSVMQELRRLADFASNDQLEHILQCGSMPDPEELSGYEYNGWNTALPFKLGPKFRKGFQQQDGGRFTGYNVNMKLDLLSLKPNCQPWEPVDGLLSAERFGFYDIKLPGQDPVCDCAWKRSGNRESRARARGNTFWARSDTQYRSSSAGNRSRSNILWRYPPR